MAADYPRGISAKAGKAEGYVWEDDPVGGGAVCESLIVVALIVVAKIFLRLAEEAG